jgi:hypothetical protein
MSVRPLLIAVVLAALGVCIAQPPAGAVLAPQYTAWEDFSAVTALKQIPELIGVVNRIERIEFGRYLVRGGLCQVEVTIRREGAKGRDGTPMPGPSHVAEVHVGDKRCD